MFNKFLSLFLQSNCPICERSADRVLCKYCLNNVQSCQLQNSCEFWQGDLPVFIWGYYGGYLKQAIASFKYDLHPEIGEIFGELLAKAWLNSGLYTPKENITVVPIPLHEARLKERGFNQADLIAKRFCQITKYDLKSNLLTRIRNTKAMFGLNPTERQENMRKSLSLGKDYQQFKRNSSILIIDDIYTTGTTAREAHQVLSSHHISTKGILAIASTQRHL